MLFCLDTIIIRITVIIIVIIVVSIRFELYNSVIPHILLFSYSKNTSNTSNPPKHQNRIEPLDP